MLFGIAYRLPGIVTSLLQPLKTKPQRRRNLHRRDDAPILRARRL
jgi:hypothetical protein